MRTLRGGLTLLGLLAVAAGTLALGYFTLFSTFVPYDDEGYFLVSVKGYLSGATLYNDIYGQYGPFSFEFPAAVFRLLGLSVTNDNGRVVTLVLWFATALLIGVTAYRLTRSVVVATAADVVAFRLATIAPNEPLHPGHLLMFLLAAITAVAVLLVDRRPRLAMALIGALGALALLSKVNIGGLALASTTFACVLASPRLLRVRPLVYVIIALFVLTPIVLMSKNAWETDYSYYAIHVTLCAAAVALVALAIHTRVDDQGSVWWLAWVAGGALSVTVVVVGVVLAQGTTVSALLRGTVLDALHQPSVFSAPLHLQGGVLVWDGMSVVAAAAVARFGLPDEDRWRLRSGMFRFLAGIWIWLAVIAGGPLGAAVALVWVAAVPVRPGPATPAARFVRIFLPALAVLQTLHAYPTAGSQVEWGGLLLVPIGAICIGDGLAELRTATISARLRRAGSVAIIVLTTLGALAALIIPLVSARHDYNTGVSLGEPGAGRIHVPATTAADYQSLSTALKSDCRTFISLPGLGSLYGMTGETPPTWITTSGWTFSVGAKTQARAVAEVRKVPGLCVVRNAAVEAFWAEGRPIPERPLYEFITHDFRTLERHGGFELMVRKKG